MRAGEKVNKYKRHMGIKNYSFDGLYDKMQFRGADFDKAIPLTETVGTPYGVRAAGSLSGGSLWPSNWVEAEADREITGPFRSGGDIFTKPEPLMYDENNHEAIEFNRDPAGIIRPFMPWKTSYGIGHQNCSGNLCSIEYWVNTILSWPRQVRAVASYDVSYANATRAAFDKANVMWAPVYKRADNTVAGTLPGYIKSQKHIRDFRRGAWAHANKDMGWYPMGQATPPEWQGAGVTDGDPNMRDEWIGKPYIDWEHLVNMKVSTVVDITKDILDYHTGDRDEGWERDVNRDDIHTHLTAGNMWIEYIIGQMTEINPAVADYEVGYNWQSITQKDESVLMKAAEKLCLYVLTVSWIYNGKLMTKTDWDNLKNALVQAMLGNDVLDYAETGFERGLYHGEDEAEAVRLAVSASESLSGHEVEFDVGDEDLPPDVEMDEVAEFIKRRPHYTYDQISKAFDINHKWVDRIVGEYELDQPER